MFLKGMFTMKKRILSIALAAVISTGVFSAPVQEFISPASVAAAASTVSAPEPSRKAGTYSVASSLTVKLTSDTSGAKIYYSTGSSYTLYTKPLKLTKNTTIKCYSLKNGVKSSVKTYKYRLTPKVSFSESEGSYDEPITVKLTAKTSGVKLYYTLDGSKPTTSSKVYSNGITISRSATLRVLAVKSGWGKKYYTYEYKIKSADASAESILEDYTNKYAYSTLTSTQKKIYAKLFEAASAHADKADLTGIGAVKSDIDKTYWAFDYDNPQFFWLANGYRYTTMGNKVISISMVYSRTKSEAEKIKPEFETAAQKIIDKALEQDTLFDRVKVIHDEIVEMTDYYISGPSYISEADGPLVHGRALCEGYSKAFMYLCQSVGIQCICVAGTGNGEPHMWNMLQLDGEWYNMDVTWDDNGGYDYFCVPTSQISADHRFDNTFPVPSATATTYTYTSAMGIEVHSTANAAYNWLVKNAAANWKKGVYTTTVYVENGIMDSLISKMSAQSFFTDLRNNGCEPGGWSANYTDRALTLTLS